MTDQDSGSQKTERPRVVAGRYALVSPLGEGGMGTVWRARDQVLQREVAIKEVRAPAGLSAAAIERMYTRLEREAWAAARVAHRGVITVHDVVMEDGRPWIVMELVRGRSLAALLEAEGTLTPRRAAFIGGEVLAALRAANEAGVLHRDVKPANVMIADDGRVVLTDFGIATVEGSTALTMTGEVVGSPEFLAPERALGREPGLASDLWSLGVLLYAAVEGITPFRQNTPLSTLRAIVDEQLPPARRAGPLTAVIDGLLRKDPDERLGAEQAARDLLLVSEGGAPETGTADVPTVTGDSVTQTVTGLARTASAADAETPYATPVIAEDQAGTSSTTQVSPVRSETEHDPAAAVTATTTAAAPEQAPATAQGPAPAQGPASAPATSPARPGPGDTHVAQQPAPARSEGPPPTVTGFPAQPPHPYGAHPDPTTAGAALPQEPPARRSRRGAALMVGALVAALVVGGTGYTLMNAGDDDKAKNQSQDAGSGAGADEQDGAASEGVRMNVTGERTTYSGPCPPANGEAPTFTATFTVDRLPAQFSYRWVSTDGTVTDDEWRTMSFPNGGSLTKEVSVSLTTWAKAGTFESAIGVELNAPLSGRSNTVPLSLTCTA
ncbi:protein kinase [Streptomyces sp. NPDC048002]|uniref:serine/threonine-protein kinase n=1 Tax=Streptomyces sp. NPDC048002 TaxID=3154344 RepID=UPI0033C803B3